MDRFKSQSGARPPPNLAIKVKNTSLGESSGFFGSTKSDIGGSSGSLHIRSFESESSTDIRACGLAGGSGLEGLLVCDAQGTSGSSRRGSSNFFNAFCDSHDRSASKRTTQRSSALCNKGNTKERKISRGNDAALTSMLPSSPAADTRSSTSTQFREEIPSTSSSQLCGLGRATDNNTMTSRLYSSRSEVAGKRRYSDLEQGHSPPKKIIQDSLQRAEVESMKPDQAEAASSLSATHSLPNSLLPTSTSTPVSGNTTLGTAPATPVGHGSENGSGRLGVAREGNIGVLAGRAEGEKELQANQISEGRRRATTGGEKNSKKKITATPRAPDDRNNTSVKRGGARTDAVSMRRSNTSSEVGMQRIQEERDEDPFQELAMQEESKQAMARVRLQELSGQQLSIRTNLANTHSKLLQANNAFMVLANLSILEHRLDSLLRDNAEEGENTNQGDELQCDPGSSTGEVAERCSVGRGADDRLACPIQVVTMKADQVPLGVEAVAWETDSNGHHATRNISPMDISA